jgi:hypothetical protein
VRLLLHESILDTQDVIRVMETDGARAERNDDPARLDTPLPIRGFFKIEVGFFKLFLGEPR